MWANKKKILLVSDGKQELLSTLLDEYSLVSATPASIEQSLKDEQYDMVVSTIPFVNESILRACKQQKLPFLIIVSDIDVDTYIDGLQKIRYEHFYLSLPAKQMLPCEQVRSVQKVPQEQIFFTGVALPPSFFELKHKPGIKEFYAIPEGNQVLLVLLLPNCPKALLVYAQELAQCSMSMHIIFLIDKNESLYQSLRQISYMSTITVIIQSDDTHIADIMAVADMVLISPDMQFVARALAFRVPMLIDATDCATTKKRFVCSYVQQNEYGAVLYGIDQLMPSLMRLCDDVVYYSDIKQSLADMPVPNAGLSIKHLIECVLGGK